jgi:prepilin-type N-terminal cleavage/methylation domain-containing protein
MRSTMNRNTASATIAASARRHQPHARWCRARRWRSQAGFSMVEVQVALVLFGIALAGLGPYMVMYTKQLRNLQQRFSPQSVYYLVPTADIWTRKLGAAAALADQDPGTILPADTQTLTQNTVQIQSLERSLTNQTITAFITIQTTQP